MKSESCSLNGSIIHPKRKQRMKTGHDEVDEGTPPAAEASPPPPPPSQPNFTPSTSTPTQTPTQES